MAWRALMKKGLNSSFIANYRTTKSSSDSLNKLPNILFHYGLECSTNCTIFKNPLIFRNYHASLGLLSYRGKTEESQGLKSRRVKKPKRENNTKTQQIPIEAKYVAPKLKLKTKPSQEKTIEIFEGISLVELSKRAGKSVKFLQEILINVGEKVNSEFDPISIDVAELVSMEVGVNVKRLLAASSLLHPRPPVVTVMGHVDHGKTSLLDALRKTSLAASEAGGITQHLGAFVVPMPGGEKITFLDTPGHAAFSAMRARGAAVTDIVVLVVAADDGVMPQTLEAIEHARSANVPIVVAINKCDKPGSNPERVKIQLGSEGLLLEDLGGDVQVVEISALKSTGLDKLEEALLLQAELMDLKARVTGPALAYVVEARVDRGRGPLVTAIVKEGELSVGNYVVVGSEWGRVRNMRGVDNRSERVIGPAIPAEIEGLKGLPMAGEEIVVVGSEERARMLSQGRRKKKERERLERLNEEREREEEREGEEREGEEGEEERERVERRELAVVVKGDVQGTVQAVSDALRSLNSPQVFVNIVHVGVGPISQSDIDMAQACNACIVGFNIRNLPSSISQAATQANIKIFLHKVIYHLLESLGKLIVETAPGTAETQVSGEAEILSIFSSKSKKSKDPDTKIAGLRVTDGRFTKNGIMRLLRSGEVVFEGSCASLRREKQDVECVGKGSECGLVIEGCLEFRVGDVVQCLESVVRKPKFVSSESGAVRIEC
ncbi:hypothetical protein LUZ60_015306 [Juncus effusus]|nr:hypothetical protein LUZ60_015306 [Juncus effusus]